MQEEINEWHEFLNPKYIFVQNKQNCAKDNRKLQFFQQHYMQYRKRKNK